MEPSTKQELLRRLPTVNDLLGSEIATGWLAAHPRQFVASCIREVVEEVRESVLGDTSGRWATTTISNEQLLERAGRLLVDRARPHLRQAINATGILLHSGLGRAAWPRSVAGSVGQQLSGYVTLDMDRHSGLHCERDQQVEYILRELTGAEAATVVNNNAAGVLLALAALAADKEVIVSRGQLIDLGDGFRLPEMIAQSGARLVEVGSTNCTHREDYAGAITEQTAAILRVRPGSYHVVGLTWEAALEDLVDLARSKWLTVVDNLGSGALMDMEQFGLPPEPTAAESIRAGADVVLFSSDKLVGAAQGGIIVGRKDPIELIRRHPLARAVRADKSCLMALERTLHLFRDVNLLRQQHPLYSMLSASPEVLQKRALDLAAAISQTAPAAEARVIEGVGYLTEGATEALATFLVQLSAREIESEELAQRLRRDDACIFTHTEDGEVLMDVRALYDDQIPVIAEAVARVTSV